MIQYSVFTDQQLLPKANLEKKIDMLHLNAKLKGKFLYQKSTSIISNIMSKLGTNALFN